MQPYRRTIPRASLWVSIGWVLTTISLSPAPSSNALQPSQVSGCTHAPTSWFAQATTSGGGGTFTQVDSFRPTYPPGLVTRTYSLNAPC